MKNVLIGFIIGLIIFLAYRIIQLEIKNIGKLVPVYTIEKHKIITNQVIKKEDNLIFITNEIEKEQAWQRF